MTVERGGRFKFPNVQCLDGGKMSESVNIALILRDIQLMRKKLDEIEEELLKLKIQEIEEEEVGEEELKELERLSKETLEDGISWEEAKKELGL